MIKKLKELQQPLNPKEEYLYGINQRLDIVIELLGVLCDSALKQTPKVTESTSTVSTPPKRRKRE